MANPLTTDFDSATGKSTTRPMTDAEYAQYLAMRTPPRTLTLVEKVEAATGLPIADLKTALGLVP